MEKAEFRKEALKKRALYSDVERAEKSRRIADRLIKLSLYTDCDVLLLYREYNNEVSTRDILKYALKEGKIVAFPVSFVRNGSSIMEFRRVTSEKDFVRGYKGIEEPDKDRCELVTVTKDTLMVMPGAAFDYNLNRIGYGKGFYDTYLNKNHIDNTVALAYECQMYENIVSQPHDIKPKLIITEETVYNGNN